MDISTVFEAFNNGCLALPNKETKLSSIEWCNHPVFEGVELKCLLTGEDTQGAFSFHLVHIAPHKEIDFHVHEQQVETHEVIAGDGECINDGVTLTYVPGTISLFPQGVKHKVIAGDHGLYLFAKFFPASL